MPATWTDLQDKEMFLAIVDIITPTVSGEHWDQIAARLGRGLTGSAVKQHYNKLKNGVSGGAKKADKSSATSTPKAGKTKSTTAANTSAKKNKKRTAADFRDDDDDAVETQEGDAWLNANEAKKTKMELSDDEGEF